MKKFMKVLSAVCVLSGIVSVPAYARGEVSKPQKSVTIQDLTDKKTSSTIKYKYQVPGEVLTVSNFRESQMYNEKRSVDDGEYVDPKTGNGSSFYSAIVTVTNNSEVKLKDLVFILKDRDGNTVAECKNPMTLTVKNVKRIDMEDTENTYPAGSESDVLLIFKNTDRKELGQDLILSVYTDRAY